jgi:hypothetical protein
MADEKTTILQPFKLRRPIELQEFALAAFYPQTRSSAAASLKRTAIGLTTPELQPLRGRKRDDPSPPENVAKPWKKPWEK